MIKDISFKISEKTYVYDGDPSFQKSIVFKSPQVSLLSMGSHTGTHIDAPKHFFSNMEGISQIDLEKLCGKAKVIHIKGKYSIDICDLEKYNIKKGDIILFKTINSEKFNGENSLDEYCSIALNTSIYLAKKGINLVGIDYMTVEPKNSEDFSVHKTFLSNKICIVENLNLKYIDEGEYKFYCLPLNIENLDGCPVRCILEK